ncbi:phosphoheptose isomerase [Hyaloraphidium curvatum]|nr:phosphoheptose isomerase [Hyaloraphidium curvatum]
MDRPATPPSTPDAQRSPRTPEQAGLPAMRAAELIGVLGAVLADRSPSGPLAGAERAASMLVGCFRAGRRVYLVGNGGSAAEAAHLAAELAGRFRLERPGLPAFALTEPCILTAVGNDYSFDVVFARQVEAACGPGDVLLAITTSGTSPNILAALAAAKRKGARTIALCGAGGELADADVRVRVPSRDAARVQEAQMLLGHAVCELVEREMFGGGAEEG